MDNKNADMSKFVFYIATALLVLSAIIVWYDYEVDYTQQPRFGVYSAVVYWSAVVGTAIVVLVVRSQSNGEKQVSDVVYAVAAAVAKVVFLLFIFREAMLVLGAGPAHSSLQRPNDATTLYVLRGGLEGLSLLVFVLLLVLYNDIQPSTKNYDTFRLFGSVLVFLGAVLTAVLSFQLYDDTGKFPLYQVRWEAVPGEPRIDDAQNCVTLENVNTLPCRIFQCYASVGGEEMPVELHNLSTILLTVKELSMQLFVLATLSGLASLIIGLIEWKRLARWLQQGCGGWHRQIVALDITRVILVIVTLSVLVTVEGTLLPIEFWRYLHRFRAYTACTNLADELDNTRSVAAWILVGGAAFVIGMFCNHAYSSAAPVPIIKSKEFTPRSTGLTTLSMRKRYPTARC